MKKILTIILISLQTIIFAQTSSHHELHWTNNDMSFDGASHVNRLPYFTKNFDVPQNGVIMAEIRNAVYAPLITTNKTNFELLSSKIMIQPVVELTRQTFIAHISFVPIRKTGNQYEKLISFDLIYLFNPEKEITQQRGPDNKHESVLKDGDIYKIGINSNGIHQIDYQFLKDSLGIDVDNLDPTTIKIYSAKGGILPQRVGLPRIDDLEEIPILVLGESDNKFNTDDRILFYGEGSGQWNYDLEKDKFSFRKNPFDDNNYYFLKIDNQKGLRLSTIPSESNPSYITNESDVLYHMEKDEFNFLAYNPPTHGSGTKWYGDKFTELNNTKSYNFNLPDLITTSPVNIQVEFLGRSNVTNAFQVNVADSTFKSNNFGKIDLGKIEITLAEIRKINETFLPNSDKFSVQIKYPLNNGSSFGALDYITLAGRRTLKLNGNQTIFRDKKTIGKGVVQFQIKNTNQNSIVWDITNSINPFQRATKLKNNQSNFNMLVEDFNTFIVFDKTAIFSNPISGEKIDNQNLHQLEDMNMVIITPNLFEAEASRLAQHRRDHDKLTVEVVNVNQIYNEFGSGRKEPTAIRDFIKMIADRNLDFNYVLLFGDGSFDFRNIYKSANPRNFIPVFETDSFYPLYSFPSDDFYGLISEGEGDKIPGNSDVLHGALDVSVGRLTASTPQEAKTIIDKLISYDLDYDSFGNWRNRMIFVADDEDNNLHINPVEQIAVKIDTTQKFINEEKIYFDAFKQISTSGGEKFPDATTSINKNIFKGALTVNYMGHGGPTGWAQERVLRLKDIDGWKNKQNMPLFITATCSFTSFDDYTIVSPGERILQNKNGGGIGLFTTVRAVFASSNEALTKAVFKRIFEKDSQGHHLRIGDILRIAKNTTDQNNSRKFLLIGDPSMRLAFPEYDVVTTSFNGHNPTVIDSIGAFDKVVLEGEIQNKGQLLTNFNGKVAVTVFDKPAQLKTLGQDPKSDVKPFKLQKNIIFNGLVSAKNGKFKCEFIVPKDINYTYGNGKISYYAWTKDLMDATGVFTNFMVGGANKDATIDDQPPTVEVFIQDENFVYGGVTDENPILFVKLKDDFGINLTGAAIGHNLTGILDDNTREIYQLNDFYTGKIDDNTAGVVKFPLFDIAPGRHKIKITAWDIANNSGEGYTEFVVANSEKMALEHVLNYPNPFTTNTNFQFEHNYPGQLVKVQIRIFSVSGKLVKTLEKDVVSDSYRIDDIAWNGDDEFGSPLARGVYLYKVKIGVDENGKQKSTESDFEKLVILK